MKAEDHVLVTGKAVELFQEFSGSPVSKMLLTEIETIKEGAKDADFFPYPNTNNQLAFL